jgi:hypothetical protein
VMHRTLYVNGVLHLDIIHSDRSNVLHPEVSLFNYKWSPHECMNSNSKQCILAHGMP